MCEHKPLEGSVFSLAVGGEHGDGLLIRSVRDQLADGDSLGIINHLLMWEVECGRTVSVRMLAEGEGLCELKEDLSPLEKEGLSLQGGTCSLALRVEVKQPLCLFVTLFCLYMCSKSSFPKAAVSAGRAKHEQKWCWQSGDDRWVETSPFL